MWGLVIVNQFDIWIVLFWAYVIFDYNYVYSFFSYHCLRNTIFQDIWRWICICISRYFPTKTRTYTDSSKNRNRSFFRSSRTILFSYISSSKKTRSCYQDRNELYSSMYNDDRIWGSTLSLSSDSNDAIEWCYILSKTSSRYERVTNDARKNNKKYRLIKYYNMFNIALNTFREMVRNRFFSLIIFLSIVLIILSLGLDSLALGENKRVIIDFWLSFIELSGLAVILFLAGGLIAREIEGRTIYLILSKPIRRWMIIFGKFLGFSVVLLLVFLIELAILMAILISQWVAIDSVFILAILGIFLKLLSLLALSLLFSTVVSPGLAMFMIIVTTIIGHGGYAVLEYAIRSWSYMYLYFARGILMFFPNLESLNLKNLVATTAIIHMDTFFIACILSLIYTFIALLFAAWIFERKSFDAV